MYQPLLRYRAQHLATNISPRGHRQYQYAGDENCLTRGPPVSGWISAIGGNMHSIKWTNSNNANVMRNIVRLQSEELTSVPIVIVFVTIQALESPVNVSVQRFSDQVRAIQ